jgi:hypothetical protein
MEGKFHLSDKFEKGNEFWHNQNIYITSDEEIKDGEYGLSRLGEIIKFHSGYDYRYYAKIILTTDQDLIKDGVQAIDDEFLEWFVKNPSCEKVEIFYEFPQPSKYKIIIPKEEPKFEDSIENSINIMSIANSMFSKKEEPKQETLEEFAKQEAIKKYSEDTFGNLIVRKSIEKGAKWQKEQMYSEEDMRAAYNAENEGWVNFDFWFEQFKKK